MGSPDAVNGANAIAQIEKAVKLASHRKGDGVVIAPLNKESLHKAGLQFPDEITFLGSLTGAPVRSVVTWNGIYRTSVTGHVRLRHVADLVTRERVSRAISDLWDAMGRLGVAPRRIGVAALNPHGARAEPSATRRSATSPLLSRQPLSPG